MHNTNTKFLALAITSVMVCMAIVAANPAGAVTNSAQSSSGGTFIFGSAVDTSVANLNPLTVSNSLASIISTDMYANSLAFQWTSSGNFTSWLAKSWTITANSNNTESITFNLNPQAQWVNGSKEVGQITSNDVKFTFEILKDNQSLDYNQISSHIQTILTPNNTTVTFLMKSVNVLWFQYIATQVIVPSAWAKFDNGHPGNLGSYTNMGTFGQEISAGPFILNSIGVNGAEMLPNTHFWMGTPSIGKYYIEKFTSSATSDLALEKGQISAVNPALSDYYALTGQKNISAIKAPAPYVFYLWMNDHIAPYNNTHFRRGLAYGINDTQIMAKAEDGVGTAGPQNMSDGGLPGVLKSAWAPNLPYYGFNKTMANSEFLKAGYHLGPDNYYVNNTTGAEAQFVVQEPSSVADWVAAGTLIANDLQAVHINAQVDVVPIGTWVTDALINASNFKETTYFGYAPSIANPFMQLQQIYEGYTNATGKFVGGPWNYENFSDSIVNQGLNNSENASTTSQLIKDLIPVQQELAKQIPIIPIANAYNLIGYNTAVAKPGYTNLSIDNPLNLMKVTVVSSPSVNINGPSGPANNDVYYYIGGIVAAIVVVGAIVGLTMRGKKGKEEK